MFREGGFLVNLARVWMSHLIGGDSGSRRGFPRPPALGKHLHRSVGEVEGPGLNS